MHHWYWEEISAVGLRVVVGCIMGSSQPLPSETILYYSFSQSYMYYWSFLYGMSHIPAFMEIMEISVRIDVTTEWTR